MLVHAFQAFLFGITITIRANASSLFGEAVAAITIVMERSCNAKQYALKRKRLRVEKPQKKRKELLVVMVVTTKKHSSVSGRCIVGMN